MIDQSPTRVAFLHTGAVVIPTTAALAARLLPGVEVLNVLDDRIVGDLGAGGDRAASVPERLVHLASDAKAAGAGVVMLTCSSISGLADDVSEAAGIPVLRIDEAMADAAVAAGRRISVIATLPTTLTPTVRLILERARLADAAPELSEVLVTDAFAAAVAGDRELHDSLVGAAITAAAPHADVIVLAQASMAGAAAAVAVDVPVLTSPELGVARLAGYLERR